jgi:hypothetical protein
MSAMSGSSMSARWLAVAGLTPGVSSDLVFALVWWKTRREQ